MAMIETVLGPMAEEDLLKLEGGFESEDEIVKWVQYHLPRDGSMIHRSAAVHLKKMPTIGAKGAAFG